MKIYGYPEMGNVRRVAIFLLEKGIVIPFHSLDFEGGLKGDFFKAKNPFSRVPVLEFDDGRCLSESIAICRYFEALHAEPPLFGVEPDEQAQIEMWQRRMELEVFIPTSMFIRHTSPLMKGIQVVQIPAWGELCEQRAIEGLRIANRQLADNVYIGGPAFSVADITLAHMLLGMPGDLGIAVPADCTNLQLWLERMYERPSIKSTQPDNYGLIQKLDR